MQKQPETFPSLWTLEDGITFSMLSKFLICRHRFWIKYVLGLKESRGFDHKSEYGNLMHAAFEAFAASPKSKKSFEQRVAAGVKGIDAYRKEFDNDLISDSGDIDFWTTVAKAHFEHYATHWRKRDEKRIYIAQEEVFDEPIELPSGRRIRLRGKIDELFQTPSKPGKLGPRTLQENKVKGRVDEDGILMSLHCDFQTMLYLVVLDMKGWTTHKVLYNVLLRPNSGGIGNQIVQRKGRGNAKKGMETREEFCKRVSRLPATDPRLFYHRFNVEVTDSDLEMFKKQILFPVLEQLADWWKSIKDKPSDPWTTPCSREEMENMAPGFCFPRKPNSLHYLRPFGVYDSLADGMRGDYFDFITSGGTNRSGLKRSESAFPELDSPSLANLKGKPNGPTARSTRKGW